MGLPMDRSLSVNSCSGLPLSPPCLLLHRACGIFFVLALRPHPRASSGGYGHSRLMAIPSVRAGRKPDGIPVCIPPDAPGHPWSATAAASATSMVAGSAGAQWVRRG